MISSDPNFGHSYLILGVGTKLRKWISFYFGLEAKRKSGSTVTKLKKCTKLGENQDGGVGRHTVPPHTTRTDRKSNCKEVRHQGNKK